MSTKSYWADKDQKKEQARIHTAKMEQFFKKEIEECVKKTKVYDDAEVYKCNKGFLNNQELITESYKKPGIIIEDIDSVSAILKYAKEKTTVLNFASYKEPGGMFLQGSTAQEECLCHQSFLYNVLSKKQNYYEYNKKSLNKALYTNRALYSPDVIFGKGNKIVKCDVITCAAPNFSTASKYQSVSRADNNLVLKSRIDFVLAIAALNQVSTLILGAYGCGVFGQNPVDVASIFKDKINQYPFELVIFAIPKSANGNLDAFNLVFQ